jgi:6-phosphogluconolactonase
MAAHPEIRLHETPDELAQAVATRLVSTLAGLQRGGRVPAVVLTGGTIAVQVHEAVARCPTRDDVDWGAVDFWFGDERFVPVDSRDRNHGQAAKAMLDHLPVDPARVHVMPPSGGRYGDDVDAAAEAYAEELRRAAGGEQPGDGTGSTPTFDVLMLGIGPDGHCASLFPGREEMHDARPVVAVRDSPKPPPTRITLTMGPLGRAREVWWLAAGDGKAEAVAAALAGDDVSRVPAAGPKGLSRTLWLLDRAAAAHLPG